MQFDKFKSVQYPVSLKEKVASTKDITVKI